jgi:hypothetical protein
MRVSIVRLAVAPPITGFRLPGLKCLPAEREYGAGLR